jgi:AcrR family transcriptional regulator
MTAIASQLGERSSRALFKKLHPRPNGLPRAQVVSHQRERLCRAMLAAAAEKGCDRTTVGELCSLAGVSKRAFYEIFDSKQECLAAAHERVVCQAARRMQRALHVEGWPQESLQAALTVLLAEAARRPQAARFALLDAIDATPAGLERQRWAALQIQQEMARRLEGTAKAPVSPLALRGIVAGLSHVICTRLLDGRAAELPLLAPKLTEWAFAYAALVAPARSQGAVGVRASPAHAGRPGERDVLQTSKLFVQRDERALLMESALILVSEGGMLRLSPDTLATHSGVPARRLHALFGKHEQCLLEAVRQGGRQLLDDAITAGSQQEQWQQGLQASLLALLSGLGVQQALAHALFVEALSLGERAHSVRAELVGHTAQWLRQTMLLGPPSSSVACEASVAAAWGVIAERVAGFRATRLQDIAAPIEALLAPALGELTCQ